MTVVITPEKISLEFIEKINELTGEDVNLCMQCGTCSATCPMSEEMEFYPRKIMHLAQLGLDHLLDAPDSYWKCASCHSCAVRCPRGIDITKVMEGLRQMALRKNQNFIDLSKIPAETIAKYPQIAMVAAFRKLTS